MELFQYLNIFLIQINSIKKTHLFQNLKMSIQKLKYQINLNNIFIFKNKFIILKNDNYQ